MPSDDGTPLAREAVGRLVAGGVGPHIGHVETVRRTGVDVLLIEVREELRPWLTPRIVAALDGLPFRLRDAGIADGISYQPPDGTAPDFPELIVEPPVDRRPELVQQMYRQLEAAGLSNVIGCVGLESAAGELSLAIGVSARVPRDREPAIRRALTGLPIVRLYWRQPHNRSA